MSGLNRSDLQDIDFIDANELAATGQRVSPYRTISVVSITNATKTIVLNTPEGLTLFVDLPVQPGDLITISGATAGNGDFTVDTIVDQTTLTIIESPGANGTGGSANFYYRGGAKEVGVNPTGRSNFTGTDLQTVLNQIDGAISAGGVSLNDFLLENEPPAPSNNYSNTFVGNHVTQEVWKRLDTTNIKTIDYTYVGNRCTVEVRKVYASDGVTINAQLTITYTYVGNKMTSDTRVRNI